MSLAALFLGLVLLVGCSREVRTRTATGPEPDQVDPSDATAPADDQPDLGEPVEATPGKVTLRLGAAEYARGQEIVVTVSNGLDRSIFTEDSKTACSVFILERQNGEDWERVEGCAVERAPLVVEIGSGRGRTEKIDPSSPHFGDTSGEPAFGSGTYRFTFTYRLERNEGEEPLAVVSPTFEIR